MVRPFHPLFSNPHIATIAGNFWRRNIDLCAFPAQPRQFRIDDQTNILTFEHVPIGPVRGRIIFLHGLEGSANAGYILSCSEAALKRGFCVCRANLRSCGGTEDLSETMYHSGLTSDIRKMLDEFKSENWPTFLVGFSLGGNVALKLTAELGRTRLLAGCCAVSTPIDLATCVRAIDNPANIIYSKRFLNRLKGRIKRKCSISPQSYNSERLDQVRTIWEFDDRFTAPLFGFGSAANYYATQSATNFLDAICLPTLVITSQDDPLVPFWIYDHPAFKSNPMLELLSTRHGGHLGFISRKRPRFWIDGVILDWIEGLLPTNANSGTNTHQLTSA